MQLENKPVENTSPEPEGYIKDNAWKDIANLILDNNHDSFKYNIRSFSSKNKCDFPSAKRYASHLIALELSWVSCAKPICLPVSTHNPYTHNSLPSPVYNTQT